VTSPQKRSDSSGDAYQTSTANDPAGHPLFASRSWILEVGLWSLLLVQAVASLWWRFVHDGPILQYYAWLIAERGLIPYRDFFDFSLPGTHIFNILWLKTLGYSDIAFRILDLCWMSGIMLLIWRIIRPFGRQAASLAVVVVGIYYISAAPSGSLEREWIIALPLLIASNITLNASSRRIGDDIVIGLCFGFIALNKPHALIGWPVLLHYRIFDGWRYRSTWQTALKRLPAMAGFSLIGFLTVVLPVFFYLLLNNALAPFLEIAQNYYPLYTQMSGGHYVITGIKRIQFLITETLRFGDYTAWIVAGGFGYFLVAREGLLPCQLRDRINVLAAMSLVCALYPTISGQFWAYHYALLAVFLCPLVTALFFTEHQVPWGGNHKFSTLVLVLALLIGPRLPLSSDFIYQVVHLEPRAPKNGRIDEIANYLREHLQPGDTVQPLDWTSGAAHALLLAKADLATSFVSDQQFYHHIESPYIVGLRKRFIRELQGAQPRYVVQMTCEDKPWPAGPTTTRKFPELSSFLDTQYNQVLVRDDFVIWERRSDHNTPLIGQ